MIKKTKSKLTSSPWDSNPEFADNTAAPTIKNTARQRLLVRRSLVVIALVGVPIGLLSSCGALAMSLAPLPQSSVTSTSVNSSRGKAAAVEAVDFWLAGKPAVLPGGRVVSWDGFEAAQAPTAKNPADGAKATYTTELHRFTLATGSGAATIYFSSQVEVMVNDVLGAKVSGTPTLTPILPSTTSAWPSEQLWLDYASVGAPQPVASAVNAWAAAYTSGKPDALRLTVGDQNAGRSYLPLSGITTATATIVGAAIVPLSDAQATPTQMLVRVTLAVQWIGQPAPKENSNTPLPLITYDLLVAGANTAAPNVVSWGGPGSGPTLTPYSTAFNGADIIVPTALPTTSPEATNG